MSSFGGCPCESLGYVSDVVFCYVLNLIDSVSREATPAGRSEITRRPELLVKWGWLRQTNEAYTAISKLGSLATEIALKWMLNSTDLGRYRRKLTASTRQFNKSVYDIGTGLGLTGR